jgi:hypothetical protein
MVNLNFTEAKARLAEMPARTDWTNAEGPTAPRHQMALGQDGNQGQSRRIKVNQTKSTFHFLTWDVNDCPIHGRRAISAKGWSGFDPGGYYLMSE